MPITGPLVQVPDSSRPLADKDGTVRFEWQQYFHAMQQIAYAASRSGPTASRPTNQLDGRYIGMPYFDTTLGFQINLESVNPDVWVDGQGNVV